MFRGGAMVARRAVNAKVVGSNPTPGATERSGGGARQLLGVRWDEKGEPVRRRYRLAPEFPRRKLSPTPGVDEVARLCYFAFALCYR